MIRVLRPNKPKGIDVIFHAATDDPFFLLHHVHDYIKPILSSRRITTGIILAFTGRALLFNI